MDYSVLKFSGPDLEKIESLKQLRERLLPLLLQSAFILATILYLISLVPVFHKGLSIPPVVYTVLYLWLALVAFEKRIPYPFRAGSWVIFFYLFGVINLSLSGLNVDSGVFFLTYIMMAVLFFDLKQGVAALGISAGSIAIFGYTILAGRVHLGLALSQTNPFLWIIGGLVLIMAGGLLTLPLFVLLRGLGGYLEKSREESETLRKTNQALQLSEERYRSLVEISPDLITLIDLDGEVVLTNRPGLALFGYSPEELIEGDYLTFIADEDHPRIVDVFQKTLEIGSVRNVICQCVRKDGTLFEAEFSTSLIRNESGEAQAVIAVGRDVTERREMERTLDEYRKELETKVAERTAELRLAEESYKTLVENSVQGVAVYQEGQIIYGNQVMADSFGTTLEKLKSLLPLQIVNYVHPDDRELMWNKYQSRLAGNVEVEHYDIRLCQSSGDIRNLLVSSVPISFSGKPALQISALDLTERRKIEQALRDSEETARTILNATDDALLLVDTHHILLAVNQAAAERFGKQPEDLAGIPLPDLFPPDLRSTGIAHFESVVENGERINIEGLLDGRVFDVNLFPVFDDYGRVMRVVMSARDVTIQRKTEQALRDSEEIARAILNATAESLILTDPDETVLAINKIASERMGKYSEELIGRSLRNLFPEEVAKKRSVRFASVVETGEPLNFEELFNDSIFDVNLIPVFDDYGQVARVLIAAKDVTERRKMEQALRESEGIARAMMDATPSTMALIDSNGVVLAANKVAARVAGMDVEELIGKNAYQIFPDDRNNTHKTQLETVYKTGQPVSFEDYRGGSWQEIHIHPIHDEKRKVGRVVVSAIDLTEHKKMEKALRDSEQSMRAMINATPSSLTMIDQDGKYLAVNAIAAERLGVTVEDMLGNVAYQFFPEDVAHTRKVYIDSVFQTGKRVVFEDFRGGYWFENHIHPVVESDGCVTRVVVSSRDMTERKKMEQDIKQSEESLRIMMNATPSALGMMDSDGRLLAANKTLAVRLQMKIEDILGKTIYQLLPEELAHSRKVQIDRAFEMGEPVQFEDTRSGMWYENHIYPIKDENGEVTRVVFSGIDLTERMSMMQSLKVARDELEIRVEERTRELTESREQLRTLNTNFLAAQEDERRRISRELHDEAGQALVSMKYSLESILADLSGKNLPIKKRLTSAVQQLDQTMDRIRFLAHSLRPPLLDIADLDLTLRDYCLEFGESTGLQVNYTGDAAANLNDQTGIAFFRFLQEALTNVVKHASATRVQVRLKKRRSHLSLIVADNGIGHKDAMNQGQGHIGMQERFRMLDGQVRIRSLSGLGFTILGRVPYREELADIQQDA